MWFRQSAGFSPRDRDQPFANFFFGGFGNNYVDHGDEKRYREYDSLAGVELNEIGGRNFVKSTVEWNLPPWRFARLGTPGLLRDVAAAGGIRDGPGHRPRRRSSAGRVGNIGAQADIRISALSALDMTLSFGGADRIRGRVPAAAGIHGVVEGASVIQGQAGRRDPGSRVAQAARGCLCRAEHLPRAAARAAAALRLLLMDSFKLLRPSSLAAALAWGMAVALVNQPLHAWLLDDGWVSNCTTLTRYVAPVAEEVMKAASSCRCWGSSVSAS